LKTTGKKSARRKGRAVTIDEVAVLAEVSPMTVSRVVNGHAKVRDSTREKVMQAVRELGYVPNQAASSLAAAQDVRIALIYTNPSGAYLRELLLGALHGAERTAAQLVIDSWETLDAAAERKAARARPSWCNRGISLTARGWKRWRNCCRCASRPLRSSPATTTWPPRPSR
jgi:LacI family transcriptional regulator